MHSIRHWLLNQLSRSAARYREWRHRVNNPEDCDSSKKLESDLERLQLADIDVKNVKARMNAPDATLETFPFVPLGVRVAGLTAFFYVLYYASRAAKRIADYRGYGQVSESLERFTQGFSYITEGSRVAGIEGVIPEILIFGAMALVFRWVVRDGLPGPTANILIYRCVHAVAVCADVCEEGKPFRRHVMLRKLDKAYRSVERNLLRIHRSSRMMSAGSPRRMPVRLHAAQVAGALRAQMRRIDTDGDTAIRGLAEMLAEVSERYACGRIGALLPDSCQLEDVTPVSTSRSAIRESLHVVLTLAAAIGAAIAMSDILPSLHVPKDLRPWVLLISAVIAGIMVSGWRGVARIIESFPGK